LQRHPHLLHLPLLLQSGLYPLLEEGSGPASELSALLSTGGPQLFPQSILNTSTKARPLAPRSTFPLKANFGMYGHATSKH